MAGRSGDDAHLLERASRDQLPRGRRHALDAGGRSATVVAASCRSASCSIRARSQTVPLDYRGNGALRARAERAAAARVRRLHRGREPRLHDEEPDLLRQHRLVQGLVPAVRREPVHQGHREQVHGHEAHLRRQPAGLGAHQHARLVELSRDRGLDQELGRRFRLAPGHQLQRRRALRQHEVLDAADEPGLRNRRRGHFLPLVEVRQHGLGRDVRHRSLHELELRDRRPLRHLRRASRPTCRASTRTRAARRPRASSARPPGQVARARGSRRRPRPRAPTSGDSWSFSVSPPDRRPLAPVRDCRRIEPAAIDRATTRCKSRSFAPATSAKPSCRKPASRRASSTRSCNGRPRPTARRVPT